MMGKTDAKLLKLQEQVAPVELPTQEEFESLLREDTLTHSLPNSTNYQVYTRGTYSRLA